MACACRSVPEVCCSRIALVLHTRLDLSWKIHNVHNMTTNSHTHHILSHYYLCANLRSTVILLKSVLQGCHCLMSCFHVQPDTSIMMRGLYTRASFLQHKDNPPMVLPSTINLTNTSTSNPPSYHHSQPIPHCTSTDTAPLAFLLFLFFPHKHALLCFMYNLPKAPSSVCLSALTFLYCSL